MNTMVLLTVMSVVAVSALFIALALYLRLIIQELEAIGGTVSRFVTPVNYLSKIRLGVRAIEVQTGGLVPQVTTLNNGLTAVRDGLGAIDANLGGVIAAVSRQEGR